MRVECIDGRSAGVGRAGDARLASVEQKSRAVRPGAELAHSEVVRDARQLCASPAGGNADQIEQTAFRLGDDFARQVVELQSMDECGRFLPRRMHAPRWLS